MYAVVINLTEINEGSFINLILTRYYTRLLTLPYAHGNSNLALLYPHETPQKSIKLNGCRAEFSPVCLLKA